MHNAVQQMKVILGTLKIPGIYNGCSSSVWVTSFESWSFQHIGTLLHQKPRKQWNQRNKQHFLPQYTDFNICLFTTDQISSNLHCHSHGNQMQVRRIRNKNTEAPQHWNFPFSENTRGYQTKLNINITLEKRIIVSFWALDSCTYRSASA